MFNKLLSTSSTTNQGTLIHIKNNFGHRNVTSDVMNCFNYAENFVRLVEALVYLFSQQIQVGQLSVHDFAPTGHILV